MKPSWNKVSENTLRRCFVNLDANNAIKKKKKRKKKITPRNRNKLARDKPAPLFNKMKSCPLERLDDESDMREPRDLWATWDSCSYVEQRDGDHERDKSIMRCVPTAQRPQWIIGRRWIDQSIRTLLSNFMVHREAQGRGNKARRRGKGKRKRGKERKGAIESVKILRGHSFMSTVWLIRSPSWFTLIYKVYIYIYGG